MQESNVVPDLEKQSNDIEKKSKNKVGKLGVVVRAALLGFILLTGTPQKPNTTDAKIYPRLKTAQANVNDQNSREKHNQVIQRSWSEETVEPSTKETLTPEESYTAETHIVGDESQHEAYEKAVNSEDQSDNQPIELGSGFYLNFIIYPADEGIGLTNYDSVNASGASEAVSDIFANNGSAREIVRLFHPELDDDEINQYLQNYKIIFGPDIDHYLQEVRGGSMGTTIANVNSEGRITFDSISLHSSMLSANYPIGPESDYAGVIPLTLEELFQAHQYQKVVAELFNNGYFHEVSGISTVDRIIEEISDQNLRAFLELIQQKSLLDMNVGKNAYNFFVGNNYFRGDPASEMTINPAWNKFESFIKNELGMQVAPNDLLNPEKFMQINNVFRSRFLKFYIEKGVHQGDVHIWNLIGFIRGNKLRTPPIIFLPEDY